MRKGALRRRILGGMKRIVLGAVMVAAVSGVASAGGSAGVNWPTFAAANGSCTPEIESRTLKLSGLPNPKVSAKMKAIFDADQADRQGQIDWEKVGPRDLARQREVLVLLKTGKLATRDDLLGAAFVFQHGNCSNHYLLAHALADQAIQRGDERSVTKFIYAATLDRYLMNTGKLQRYATQYMGDSDGCNMKLSATDPATTDAERLALNLPTLAAAEARASQLNQPNCPK